MGPGGIAATPTPRRWFTDRKRTEAATTAMAFRGGRRRAPSAQVRATTATGAPASGCGNSSAELDCDSRHAQPPADEQKQRRRRPARTRLEAWRPLVVALIVCELHLAIVGPKLRTWSTPTTGRHDCESRRISADRLAAPSLNNLINYWPGGGPRSGAPSELQSMVVSLFAFPLCAADELAGQQWVMNSEASARDKALPWPDSAAKPEVPPTTATTGTTNVATYEATTTATTTTTATAQPEIPINSGAQTSASNQQDGEKQRQLRSGQNDSNNNNNNETAADRNPPAGGGGARLETLQTTSESSDERRDDDDEARIASADPNSARATASATKMPAETISAAKTKQAATTAGEEANSTMTMTRPTKTTTTATAARQHLQQQQHLTMTAAKSRQTNRDAAMDAVVCNSRCQCVQLEFGNDASSGPANAATAKRHSSASCEPAATQRAPSSNGEAIARGPTPQNRTKSDEFAETQSSSSSSPSSPSANNRVALIEFSQDYSFDDELELAANESTALASNSLEDELADGANKSAEQQQAPTTTATTTATVTAATGNGRSQQSDSQQQQQRPSAAAVAATTTGGQQTDRSPEAAGSLANTTIKRADDQSKVVNVSSAPAVATTTGASTSTGAARGGDDGATLSPQASRLMLSIKDNKTGTGAATSDADVKRAVAGGGAGAGVQQVGHSADGNQRTANTDKDSGLSTQLSPTTAAAGPPLRRPPQQPEPATVGNFFPFLGARHHLHQRHHLADHQLGPAISGLPPLAPSSSLPSSSSAGNLLVDTQVAGGGATDLTSQARHWKPDGDDRADERANTRDSSLLSDSSASINKPIRRISPLRSRSVAAASLERPDEMASLLEGIQAEQVQSLCLRSNRLKFEQWTEVYALLAVELRQNLFHLDLAHNELVKLGVTFTGYIEHHLAYQLLAHNNNQSWPFPAGQPAQPAPASLASSSSSSLSSSSSTSMIATGSATVQTGRSGRAQLVVRHPSLGDGHLFNAVRALRPLDYSSLLLINHHSRGGGGGNTFLNGPNNLQAANQSAHYYNHHHGKASHIQKQLQQSLTILHQPIKLRALDLSHNKLRWLINDQFRTLRHAESIRLDHNQIRFIHQQAFNGLESLKYLNLNYNRIQTIYMEQFQTNYNLQALFMRSNYLNFLRAGSFAAQNQLRHLDLSKNKFTFLSNNAFAGLDSLKLLNLSSNSFIHVPSTSFHSLAAKLKTLDLSRNLLAQLMPGTFFHMKLERLILDNNDQLVAIDRGAFWDLPYLRYLSLGSSQVLISVNSQSFVGVPNLETINYENCQLLDAETRQMLDNITSATTLRQLNKQQHQQQAGRVVVADDGRDSSSSSSNNNNNNNSATLNAGTPSVMSPLRSMSAAVAAAGNRQQMSAAAAESGRGAGQADDVTLAASSAARWIMKYVYSAGALSLIVVALKFALKYTSAEHYLEARRRRRRVYQSSSAAASSSGRSCASSASTRSCPSSAASTASLPTTDEDARGDPPAGRSEQRRASNCNSEASLDEEDVSKGEAMLMRELQPHRVIIGAARQVADRTDEMATSEPVVVMGQAPGDAMDTPCQATLAGEQHNGQFVQEQQRQQQQQQQPFLMGGCYDCCRHHYSETLATNQHHDGLYVDPAVLSVTNHDGSSLECQEGQQRQHEQTSGDTANVAETMATAQQQHQHQSLDQSQICDNLTSTTNLEGAQAADGQQLGGVVFEASFASHSSQVANPITGNHQWRTAVAEQQRPLPDCRIIHCACIRCAGPADLVAVSVNGYI